MFTAPIFDLTPTKTAFPFLQGGGVCAELIADRDWSTSSLGPIAQWPQCLTSALSLLLRSRVPMVMMWGQIGVMLYNDAYSNFAGGRHPDSLGSAVRESWPEVAAFNDAVIRKGLSGETAHYRDQQMTLLRNGAPEQVWMDLDYSPVPDAEGNPAGVICILSETTERVAAQRRSAFLLSLSDDLRSLKTPAEITNLAAIRVGELLDASRVFYAEITSSGMMTVERDYSRSVGSIAGVHSLASFGPDLLAAYRNGAPVVVYDVPGDDRLSAPAREGLTAREVGAFIDVVLFEEEQWVGLLAVQNATPRVWSQAEEMLVQEVGERVKSAIERARAERDRLWDLSQDMLARADFAGMMSAVNPAWTRVLGWSENDLLTREYTAIIHPDDVAHSLEVIARMAQSREPARFENRIAAQGGSWKSIEWTAAPEPDGINFVAVGRDLTETNARKIELEAAQEALRHSQKLEAIGQLTGGIAHDFNNMLTGIVGSLDLIQRNIAAGRFDRVDRYINAGNASAQRAAALTSRLLAFGRRQSLDLKPTDINGLVSGMSELLERTLGEQTVLETHFQADLWAASTDTNQLESALLNLCINARDAMPDGGRLIIETDNTYLDEHYTRDHPGLEPGQYVILSVSDTGIGMAPSTIEKVFEPFFTTKPVGQGTGLGLSMIYGFAQQSGGHVRIYSELGFGTTVKLFVPRSHGEKEVVKRREAQFPLGSGEAVMVVEDDPSVRLVVTEVLRELCYNAIEATDATSALPLLQSDERIDLLVTDVGLPGMNGRQLAEIAREVRPALKVLFITGYAQNAAIRSDFLGGGMDMMTKPFAADALALKVHDMIIGVPSA
ncbi:ATP-binding protein [Novosphingobium resinovorum]|uniref:histidine kinase n=1 Tax=Novosphingobium resinovorum TaxID=158500 RepID=A0A1D8AE53_9SPHN|nr:ATP-binding protein [Novosphingobium resinovorum]AOR80341.1 hybrid sensor histidine kinase/response regulator [Novosphingobium resinovorum]